MLLLELAAALALQLFFVARIALMIRVDPQSTTFQRSEIWRLAGDASAELRWRQRWVPYARISQRLKLAVVAAEDDGFALHGGADWAAIGAEYMADAPPSTELGRAEAEFFGRAG